MGVVAAAPRTAAGHVPALGGAAVVCAGVAVACGTRVLRLVAGVATAGPDELVELVVLAAGVAVLAWLAGSAALAVACLLVRRAGGLWRDGEVWVHRFAPTVVRRTLVVTVAAGLGAAAMAPASADPLAPITSPTTAATVVGGAGPDLGWVVRGPAAAATHSPDPGSSVGGDGTTGAATSPRPDATTLQAATAPATAGSTAPATATDQDAPAVPCGGRSAPGRRSTAVMATVVVVRGDTLWGIAARHLPAGAGTADVAAAWPAWYAANAATIGPDPGLILPGQVLVVPSEATR